MDEKIAGRPKKLPTERKIVTKILSHDYDDYMLLAKIIGIENMSAFTKFALKYTKTHYKAG